MKGQVLEVKRGGAVALTGTVKWFDVKKGFGFIRRDDGGEDIFVHHSDVDMKGFRQLNENERVEFVPAPGKKGLKATQVRVI